ncbi:MAG: PRC-barrel domain-containing protein [Gemmatimonadales bacterium]
MREIQVYQFLGKRVVDADGHHIGRVEEIEATRGDDNCAIDAYIIEHRGLLDRVGTWALSGSLRRLLPEPQSSRPYRVPWDQMDLTDPGHPRVTVPADQLQRVSVSQAPRDT